MTFLKQWWWAIGYLIVYFIVTSLVVINRWNQYEMTYFDHGIYDQALWKASRWQPPLIDHFESKSVNQLGDHFTLLMYVLVPVYWITSSYTALFYIQNLITGMGIAMMAVIAWNRLHSRGAVALILISTSLFIGLQNALIGDFHADILGLLPLAFMLYALDRERWRQFYIWLILLFMAKESFVLIGMTLALYLFLTQRKKHAFFTLMVSLVYYLMVVRFLMPLIAGRPYQYGLLLATPGELIQRFFVPFIKVKTMIVSLLTFGFLPLLAPAFLPVILQDWIMRFVFNLAGTRIDLGMHYNIMITFLLAYGSILGMSKVPKKILPVIVSVTILAVFGIHRFWYHGPLGLVLNSAFYSHSGNFAFLNNFVASVPNPGLVMTSNNLSIKLSHSREIMLFRNHYWEYMPDVIMVDIRKGQNANHYWPLSPDDLVIFVDRLKLDPNYTVEPFTTDQLYFVKKNNIDLRWYEQYEI